jgi:hypothetical protein
MSRVKRIKSLFHPPVYQGWGKKKRYFEGWYFKIVDPSEKQALAIIPGVAMDKHGERQAFVQVLDGKKRTAAYHKYAMDEFSAQPGVFEITIANNLFSSSQLDVDLPGLKGKLSFGSSVPWPNRWHSPGIMGPYTFAPFMECYHGIVSMDHEITGNLSLEGQVIDFTGGRGYIEKDWGRSFPSAYFWMQSNHFEEPGISLKASVAKIPWVTGSFTGFIAGLWFKDKLYQFTTYNGTRLIRSHADLSTVKLFMENKHHRLELEASRDHATSLASPIQGFMDGRIEESMTALVRVQMMEVPGRQVLFEGTGRNTGLEVAGNIEEIMT